MINLGIWKWTRIGKAVAEIRAHLHTPNDETIAALRDADETITVTVNDCNDTQSQVEMMLRSFKAATPIVKAGPITENETVKIINADGMHMAYATVTTYNGTPNWATLQVKLNG